MLLMGLDFFVRRNTVSVYRKMITWILESHDPNRRVAELEMQLAASANRYCGKRNPAASVADIGQNFTLLLFIFFSL